MKRRKFLTAGAAATGLLTTAQLGQAATPAPKKRDYYELRTYLLENNRQEDIVESYLQNAFIPALNRQGIKPVGVFKEMEPGEQKKLWVLITYPSIDKFTNLISSLQEDKDYLKKGAEYLDTPKSAPGYERIISSFMAAFDEITRIEAPGSGERMFELRRYESHNEAFGNRKVHMFNEAGEIAIFRETGLQPVFFGKALIGEQLPNLTYMVWFKDMAAHDEAWAKFREHPEWVRIKDLPEYKDTVSNITKTYLKPTSYSQV